MRYLQETKDFMLTYRTTDNLEVVDYSDFDYPGRKDELKSTSCYICLLFGEDIPWKCTKQSLQARSRGRASRSIVQDPKIS